MNQLKRCYIGLLVLEIALNLGAQPILIAPQGEPVGGTSLSNLRVGSQSADGTETILTVDFSYDGIRGPTARILPIITDQKQLKVSRWFGANPVSISGGRGTISLRVKFFNDEPGVPAELTTDHVNIIMLTDRGNAKISEARFAHTLKWGSPNSPSAKVPKPPQAQAERPTEERTTSVAPAIQPPSGQAPFELSLNTKTKVTNVDVVSRNIDRTEMTLVVEYQYAKEDGLPKMGIDLASSEEPGASAFFTSPVVDLARGKRGIVTFPVKFNSAAAKSFPRATLATDKVWIYLTDGKGSKSYVYQSTMILIWQLSGGSDP